MSERHRAKARSLIFERIFDQRQDRGLKKLILFARINKHVQVVAQQKFNGLTVAGCIKSVQVAATYLKEKNNEGLQDFCFAAAFMPWNMIAYKDYGALAPRATPR